MGKPEEGKREEGKIELGNLEDCIPEEGYLGKGILEEDTVGVPEAEMGTWVVSQ